MCCRLLARLNVWRLNLNKISMSFSGSKTLVAMAVALLSGSALAGATIKIINADPPGVGFNDATPVAPVGGNAGVTLGEQRMNVYKKVAKEWGKLLPPGPPIKIEGSWPALTCTSTSAVLGSAGAYTIWSDFPNAPYAGTWYSGALANTLAGEDLDAGDYPEIASHFNVNLGQPNCLSGSSWYLGLDGATPAGAIDFATVLMHEVGHGLGFQALTSGSSGARIDDGNGNFLPSIWERFMLDNSTGKTWLDMTDAERKASALNPRGLVWQGENVTMGVPSVLKKGTPLLNVSADTYPAIAGAYQVGAASFGPQLGGTAIKGALARVIDQADGVTGLACNPLSAENAALVAGKLALVDRGTCAFTIKVKNAQVAGALGVVVADNTAGGPPAGMSGTDATITIPSVRITLADAQKIKSVLTPAMPSSKKVKGSLGVDKTVYAGADKAGRVMLYTPNPYQSGSSVSHYDTLAYRNLLMEPFINSDLVTFKVAPPQDLTLPLLKDIGY